MGILKTAMYGGAAMYGVKQIANAAQAHGGNQNTNYSQGRAAIDPDYLEYLEWKKRTAQSAISEGASERVQGRNIQSDGRAQTPREEYSARQDLYLTDNMPPSYDYPFENRRPDSAARYQPMDFVPPRQSGFVEGEADRSSSGGRGGLDLNALVGQGMNLLQSQGGKGGKGDFANKFLNK